MKLSSLSILIPAYKDEKTIATVIERAILAGRRYSKKFEIVVLDDASPDKLSSVLSKLKRTTPMLHIMTHAKNQGYGGTIKDLYIAGKYEWLFTTPGDYQIDPMEIGKLVMKTKHADMIIGWRSDRKDTPARKRQSGVYNTVLRFLFGIPLHDINSVRLMKRRVMRERHVASQSAFVDAELTMGAIRDGYVVVETHIAHRPRETQGGGGGKLSVILPVIKEMLWYKFLT